MFKNYTRLYYRCYTQNTVIKKFKLEIITLFLFLFLLPICLHVTYWQNDEGIFYGNVQRFLSGDLSLHPLTAPTFYTQGFLAVTFSLIFGFSSLPFLTLAVSVGCVYVLSKILSDRFKLCFADTVFYTLLLFFNPLFMYSAFGFMTENYFLLFFLITLYFYLGETKKDFTLGNMILFLAYMVRQLALVLPLAFSIFLFLRNRYKKAAIQFGIFILLLVFHFFIAPKTPEMFENDFKFSRLTYFRYTFSFFYIIGIYLASLLLPIFSSYVVSGFKKLGKTQITTGLGIICIAFAFCFFYFKPSVVWHDKFFYLINVLQRNGFYTENVHGFKPRFMQYDGLYFIWDLVSKIILISFAYIIIKKRELISLSLITVVLYSGLLLISPKIHDRYLLPLFPLMVIFFADKIRLEKISRTALVIFVALLGFYSYNFTFDYVLTNEYVWNKSKELVSKDLSDPGEIVSTALWNFTYPSTQKGYTYKFTYDPPEKEEYSKNHDLIDIAKIRYPLNFWRSQQIYLYRHKP